MTTESTLAGTLCALYLVRAIAVGPTLACFKFRFVSSPLLRAWEAQTLNLIEIATPK